MEEKLKSRNLQVTPTWAVAAVCFILVVISIAIEQIIHHLGGWLKKKNRPALYEALDKVKTELMLMGFISLLLTMGQNTISGICVPQTVATSWLPCESTGKYENPCKDEGKVQLISDYGMHELHIFIFVLAITHILYALTTLALGRLKMRKWKAWEDETKTVEYQYYNDPERFRFARETSFGRRHLNMWSKSPILSWIACFFRQFFTSVTKVDYLTLRHGFITAHLAPQSQFSFDFQKYISRSLEDDFKLVVGISPIIWLIAVLCLLSYTDGWYSYYWLPFFPLILLLLIGAKLQMIITKMGVRILDKGDIVKGTPMVKPGDDLFWFNRPRLMLFLIQFILFQNAFQLGFFVFSWYKFGMRSCFHQRLEDIIIRISMGVIIQFLCSYVTLPLYALVTQMGSKMKPVIFGDKVATAIKSWHHNAKKNLKHGQHGQHSGTTTPYWSRPASPTHGTSPLHLLQGYRGSTESLQTSPRKSNYENEGWYAEGSPSLHHNPDGGSVERSIATDRVRENLDSTSTVMAHSTQDRHETRISLADFAVIGKER